MNDPEVHIAGYLDDKGERKHAVVSLNFFDEGGSNCKPQQATLDLCNLI